MEPVGPDSCHEGMTLPDVDSRRARYGDVATALALHSDRSLRDLVAAAPIAGAGIGGVNVLLDVEGAPVFVKRVPLTDLELRPEHVRSTANLFGLPTFCQYGVGSPGFGAWRELATHEMTTNWVLAGRSPGFPLLYHWRVVTGLPPRPPPQEYVDVDGAVAYWHGSAAVRQRLAALAGSSASLLLFLEYVPHSLRDWLTSQLADDRTDAPCAMVEREIMAVVSAMSAESLVHFDAHFRNVLTDGQRLFVSDFGLATSARFDLSPAERVFLRTHRTHDGGHLVTELVNLLVTGLGGVTGPAERNEFVCRWAAGARPVALPPAAAAVLTRYAPVAAVMNDFYWKLHGESRKTPYPAAAIRRACTAIR